MLKGPFGRSMLYDSTIERGSHLFVKHKLLRLPSIINKLPLVRILVSRLLTMGRVLSVNQSMADFK